MKKLSIILLVTVFKLFTICAYPNFVNGNNLVNLTKAADFTPSQTGGFEENKGQVTGEDANQVKFIFQRKDLSVFLMNNGITYQFSRVHYPKGFKHSDKLTKIQERQKMDGLKKDIRAETYRMDVVLVDVNPNAWITTESKSSDYTQYYNHHALNVYNYRKIIYHDVYPCIDWVVYVKEDKIKYDFIVRPGGNPGQIKLQTKWAEQTLLTKEGSIVLKSPMGDITEQMPISYQGHKKVKTQFILENNTFGFNLDEYNSNETLVIDPAITWATYYGGGGEDVALDCTTDASGNVFLAGRTHSGFNIASGGHQNTAGSSGFFSDAFLVKFSSSGVRQWGTYFGGTETDLATSCVTDGFGNVYLAGTTYSNDIICFNGFQNTYGGGSSDAFLVKFNGNGVCQWATYYGGSGSDDGNYCAIDNSNNLCIVGQTSSTSNIAFGGYQNTHSSNFIDGYIAKFNSNGLRLWGSYYKDNIVSCSIDNANNIYFSGWTEYTAGIAFGGHQNTFGGAVDSYLTKCNSSGVPVWSTYYGGEGGETPGVCAIDGSGNVFLAGATNSHTGIAFNGHQDTCANNSYDAYLVKFDSNGVRQWGTYFGGSQEDQTYSCSVDGAGNVYLTGYTISSNNIASGGFQNTFVGGDWDAFVVKFNASGVRYWGSYYGGSNLEVARCSRAHGTTLFYMGGATTSTGNISSGGHQNMFGGLSDAFLAKIGTNCISPAAPTGIAVDTFCHTGSVNNLSAAGTHIQWYDNPSGGIALNGGVELIGGMTYYASQMVNGCESVNRFAINVTVNQPEAPTGLSGQTFCAGAVIADISVVGSNIQWYSNTTGGVSLDPNLALVSGTTYYASQTINGCESIDRLAVEVSIGPPTAPTGSSIQTFCNSGIISDLIVIGSSVQWYADLTGTTLLNSTDILTNGETYFASQSQNGCESTDRFAVTVSINSPTAPTGSVTQGFCNGASIADLAVNGTGIQWYSDSNGTLLLNMGTSLLDGTTYYASQTVNTCESLNLFGVTVSLTTVNASVIAAEVNLTASQSGAFYQWIDCENMTLISGATEKIFTPSGNGNYAVIVTINNCTDTSDCFAITKLDIDESENTGVLIYPNPVNELLTINLNAESEIAIYSITSQFIERFSGKSEYLLDVSNYASGLYYIRMNDVESIRFTKE